MAQSPSKTAAPQRSDTRVVIKLDDSKLLGCTLKGRSMAGDVKPVGLVKPQREAV